MNNKAFVIGVFLACICVEFSTAGLGGIKRARRSSLSDPNIVLLMRMDGANNGMVFVEETGKSITQGGTGSNVVTSTTQIKFGDSSAYFVGGKALVLPVTTSLQLPGDFTIETWFYVTTTNPNYVLLGDGGVGQIQINQDGTSKIGLYDGAWKSTTNTMSIAANTWHFLAITRSGTSLRFYLNGNLQGSVLSYSGTPNYSGATIGAYSVSYGPQRFSGYMDDFRITKGVARYTGATMTVPTVPF